MEEEFGRHIVSSTKEVCKKCEELCSELNLTPRLLLNQIFKFLQTRKRPKGSAEDAAGRVLTLDTLDEFCSSLAGESSSIVEQDDDDDDDDDVKLCVGAIEGLDLIQSLLSNNETAFLEMSLKIIKDISSSNNVRVRPALDKYMSCEMCIAGTVLKKKGNIENTSFLFKARTSSNDEREIEVLTFHLAECEFYSGQIIVIDGEFLGNLFVAKRIYNQICCSCPKFNLLPKISKMIIAKGPFLLDRSILASELIQYVISNPPNYLILFGPFIEQTFDLDAFVETLMLILNKYNIKLILVSSLEDASTTIPVFPQSSLILIRKHSNVILLPNPFVIELNGVLIGGTSSDVLLDLKSASTECHTVFTLTTQIVKYKCFYPLYPARGINVDYTRLSRFGQLTEIPHLLVLCSEFEPFEQRNCSGCTIINPGHFTDCFAAVAISNAGVQCNILM